MSDLPLIADGFSPLVDFIEGGIPFNLHLGLKVELLRAGEAVLRIPWGDHLVGDVFRPSVHGGVTSMLIDTAGGCVCFTQLMNPEDRASTVDLRVDYLRPAAHLDLYCQAAIIRLGNKVAVCRMEVFSGPSPWVGGPADAKPIATGQGVYNVLRQGEGGGPGDKFDLASLEALNRARREANKASGQGDADDGQPE